MTYLTSDRRSSRRRRRMQEHGIVHARVRPGHLVTVIDVSAGGVCVETDRRLLPGSCVELHVESENRRACLRGRVVRCAVAAVRAASISYRGAIAFDRHLPWFEDDGGYDVPTVEKRIAVPFRANATPEVV
jgi:PilZ domain-containing protein